jgi:hypothetical protein
MHFPYYFVHALPALAIWARLAQHSVADGVDAVLHSPHVRPPSQLGSGARGSFLSMGSFAATATPTECDSQRLGGVDLPEAEVIGTLFHEHLGLIVLALSLLSLCVIAFMVPVGHTRFREPPPWDPGKEYRCSCRSWLTDIS